MQNRLFWSTAHVQDCFIEEIYVKQSPGLYSTRTVSNTIPEVVSCLYSLTLIVLVLLDKSISLIYVLVGPIYLFTF